jgi:hypothetical protein
LYQYQLDPLDQVVPFDDAEKSKEHYIKKKVNLII